MLDLLSDAPAITAMTISIGVCMSLADTSTERGPSSPRHSADSFYDFTVKDIAGNDVSLDRYKGNVCLVVNVASQ